MRQTLTRIGGRTLATRQTCLAAATSTILVALALTGCTAAANHTSEPEPTATVTVTARPEPAATASPDSTSRPNMIPLDTSAAAPTWTSCPTGQVVAWAQQTQSSTLIACWDTGQTKMTTTAIVNGAIYTSTDANSLDGCFNFQATDQQTTICYQLLNDTLVVQNGEVIFRQPATDGWFDKTVVGD